MSNRKEIVDYNRRKILPRFGVGFGIWQGINITRSFIPELYSLSGLSLILMAIQFIATVFIAFQLFQMIQLVIEIRKEPNIKQALNDEYVQFLHVKSFCIAFWVSLITQGLLLLCTIFYSLTAENVLNIMVFVSVLSVIITFLRIDHE